MGVYLVKKIVNLRFIFDVDRAINAKRNLVNRSLTFFFVTFYESFRIYRYENEYTTKYIILFLLEFFLQYLQQIVVCFFVNINPENREHIICVS